MNGRIGYNIHATSPNFDKGKLYTHLQKTRPSWVLVLDGLQTARDIKQLLPLTNVIHRTWPDEELWKSVSPADWVALKQREIGAADVWCHTINEQALPDALCDWFTKVIELAAAVNLKVVVGNCSVGTPAPEQWHSPAAIRMLKALAKHRNTAVLALHEYFVGVPTSGVLGGYPDNAGVKPGDKGGINLVPAANWPKPETMKIFTCFHMGRFKFMVEACKANGIQPPRVVLTEFGADDVSDIKAWADTLPRTAPYNGIRGWKSCVEAWKKFYPQWSAQQAYYEMVSWADRAIYMGSCVEGEMLFSWGHSSESWDQFDVSQAFEFQRLLETAPDTPAPPTPPIPPEIPPAPVPDPVTKELEAILKRQQELVQVLEQLVLQLGSVKTGVLSDIETLKALIAKQSEK